MNLMSPSFWKSILGAKKAITAGVAVLITFVSATLANNGGKNLTLQEWMYAVGAYVATHGVTYLVSNEGSLPITKVISSLVSNPTVTAALVALGVPHSMISPLVEPTVTVTTPAPAVPADVTLSTPAPPPVAPVAISDPTPPEQPSILTNTSADISTPVTTPTGTADVVPPDITVSTYGRHASSTMVRSIGF